MTDIPTPDESDETVRQRDRENLKWFWHRYLKSRMPVLFIVLGMILIQGLVYQQFLALTESGLRVIFESGAVSDLVRVCLFVFLLFAARGLLSYLVPRLTVKISNQAVYELRRDLLNHLMTLDLAYFDRAKSGEIIQKLVTQAQQLGVFVGQATVNAVRDGVTVIIVSAYLIWKNPILFTAALVVLPVIFWIMNLVSGRIKRIQARAETALGDYIGNIEQAVSGMRTVKIASQEKVEAKRLMTGTTAIRDLMTRVQTTQALVLPTIDLSSAFVYVLVIGGGGYMALSPQFDMDGASIITFLLGMVMVFDPARLLANFFAQLQSNLVLLDQVRDLFRETPSITDHPDAVAQFDTSGAVALENIRFGYSRNVPLFDGLSMQFQGGAVSAIVGATGSGKTTILSLLSRLYDVEAGQISIGGQPIDQIQLTQLRQAFSVVAQDIVIFNASIMDNIRYVRPDASEAELWAAAEAAEIAELIRTRGDQAVGPKGAQLSGGQKQRIAIARAFLADAPILLLDEATSALDQATEDRIKSALSRLSKGRTTIIVAHRLSSIADADQIFVLDQGRLVEQGRHAELLAQGGRYALLYSAQKQGYADR